MNDIIKTETENTLPKEPLARIDVSKPGGMRFFVGQYSMDVSNESDRLEMLAAVLIEIRDKKSHIDAIDYCDEMLRYLFSETFACFTAERAWTKEILTRPIMEVANDVL